MNTTITGRKPIIEALRAGTRIEKILLLAGARGPAIEEIRTAAERHGIRVSPVTRDELQALAPDAATQGIAAIVPARRLVDLEDIVTIPPSRGERGMMLLLDEIEDPHNLGALIRTAECAGIHGVILPRHHAAPVTATVVKTSAGATEHIAIAQVTNLVAAMKRLKQEGYWVIGLDVGGDRPFTAVDYRDPVALVVGNEGKGLRRLVREHCDHRVTIPLKGRIASLNASVAGALVMYEAVRQRGQSPATNPG